MRRLLAFFGGVLGGGAIGTALVLLFTPASGDSMRRGLSQWKMRVITAGEVAAQKKRQELESELAVLTDVKE